MTDRPRSTDADSATETHHEPHGAAAPHGAADDIGGHGPDDGGHGAADAGHGGHDDEGEELGPVDVPAWTAGALGIALGLIVVACLVAATGGFGG